MKSYPVVTTVSGQQIQVLDALIDSEPDEEQTIIKTGQLIERGTVLLVSDANGGRARYAAINPNHITSISCVPFN